MALCLAQSLIDRKGFDAGDQMARYVNWWRRGYLSSTGSCFDIGMTTQRALARYEVTGDPYAGSTDPSEAGNGSVMRLAPVVLFYFPARDRAVHFAAESSRTTHGAAEAMASDHCRTPLAAPAIACSARAERSRAASAEKASFMPRPPAPGSG